VVKAALEQVKTADVDAWMKEQMGPTVLSKRRKALGSWRKNKSKDVGCESAGILLEKAVGF
jgi:hypothetical protein